MHFKRAHRDENLIVDQHWSKENAITFHEKQIEDVIQFASYLEKLGNEVKIVCIAHFPYKG